MTFFYDLNKRMADLAIKQDLNESKVAESEKWIQGAVNPAHKGNLHKALHVAQGETIPKAKIAKATHSKNPKLRHMAQFAKNVANEATDEWSDETPWTDIPKSKTGKSVNPRGEVAHMSDAAQRQSAGMTPKQKKFAKLAPPTDKITFADKIAGAKKEVDEMLGDVAAEAMKNAVRGKQEVADEGNAFTGKLKSTPKGSKFKLGGKTMTDTSEVDEGYAEMDAWMKSREKEKGTGKFDKKERTLPSGMKATTYTRKHEDDEEDRDDSKDKQADKYASPKKKGRPKSAAPKDAERVTKGSHKYKTVNGKRVEKDRPTKTKEALDSDSVMMTRPTNCSSEAAGDTSALKSAIALLKKNGYNISKKEAVDEKSVSQAQAHTMAAAAHDPKFAKKVGIKGSVAKEFNKADTGKDISKLPKKVKAEEVEETTTSGSVATVGNAAPKASKGMQFGKGVYESFNSSVEKMITESIDVNETVTEHEGQGKTITVTASGPEADMLMQLLKMAGLSGQGQGCGCGTTPCSCETVDEAYGDTDETLNNPDWPTDTETLDAEPNLRTYSGGLNGPKSTGQTTIPVVASQLRRQVSMEENVELERNLFKTWKNYKG